MTDGNLGGETTKREPEFLGTCKVSLPENPNADPVEVKTLAALSQIASGADPFSGATREATSALNFLDALDSKPGDKVSGNLFTDGKVAKESLETYYNKTLAAHNAPWDPFVEGIAKGPSFLNKDIAEAAKILHDNWDSKALEPYKVDGKLDLAKLGADSAKLLTDAYKARFGKGLATPSDGGGNQVVYAALAHAGLKADSLVERPPSNITMVGIDTVKKDTLQKIVDAASKPGYSGPHSPEMVATASVLLKNWDSSMVKGYVRGDGLDVSYLKGNIESNLRSSIIKTLICDKKAL